MPAGHPFGLARAVAGPSHRPEALHCTSLLVGMGPLFEHSVATHCEPPLWLLMWAEPPGSQTYTVRAGKMAGLDPDSVPVPGYRAHHLSTVRAKRRTAAWTHQPAPLRAEPASQSLFPPTAPSPPVQSLHQQRGWRGGAFCHRPAQYDRTDARTVTSLLLRRKSRR